MPAEAEIPQVNQELLLALIRALDAKVELLVSTQKESVQIAMAAASQAVAKAEQAADKRFEGLNELRGMVADWRSEFARMSTVDLQIKSVNDRIDEVRNQMSSLALKANTSEARGTGRNDIWGYIVGGAGLMVAIASLLALLPKH